MPPWLRELLERSGSAGFVDSLQTLVGRPVRFEDLPPRSDGRRELGGKVRRERDGSPVIGLSPFTRQNFSRTGLARDGYRPADPHQKFGDYVLGHEFGHVVGSGGTAPVTLALSEALGDDVPQTNKANEALADDFQNAVQFLRHGTTDTLSLDPRSRRVVRVLLKHDPYKGHALNRQRPDTLESRLMERAGSKDSTQSAPKTLEQLLQSSTQRYPR